MLSLSVTRWIDLNGCIMTGISPRVEGVISAGHKVLFWFLQRVGYKAHLQCGGSVYDLFPKQ